MTSTPGPSRAHRTAQGFTLLLTNAIKLAGLGAAIDQIFVVPHPESLPLIVAAFMMAGAQVSEEVVLALFDRLLGARYDAPRRDVNGRG